VNDAAQLARGIIMAGIDGTSFDSSLPRFGGYLILARDGATLREIRALTDALRERAEAPVVIAVDQEGGRVARLRQGVEPMPPAMAFGAADELESTQRAGEQVAFDLRRAGCTLDFAPVLDLALESSNTVIGTRSFGSDPEVVALLGSAFARGLRQGGILPCYKHFPGHGATGVDSHEALPLIDAGEAALRHRDLVPFSAVAPDAPAMMSAHVLVRAFDARQPATLSHRILHDLLRRQLGFSGAVVTDCLEMKAVGSRGSVRSAVEALAAGADLLVFSHDVELAASAAAAITNAVQEGRVPLQRLQEAHARVSRLSEAGSAALAIDAFPPHPGIGREVARRAMTSIRGVPEIDPVATVALSFGGTAPVLHREAPALEEILIPMDPDAEQTAALLATLAQRERRPLLLSRRAHLHPAQARSIQEIVGCYPDALVVSLLEPFDLPLFTEARHLVAAYGDDAASIGGLADVLFSGHLATGRLPVALSS
jgi:beta-N-acetylhexosaminidase